MKTAKKTVILLMLFTLGFAVLYIANSLLNYAGADILTKQHKHRIVKTYKSRRR